MKKNFALALAILMMLMLVACGNDTPQGNVSDTDAETQKAELSRGKIEGDVYKNEFLGFEFVKPSSWVYSTDEEIAAVMNVAVDNILGDKYKEALENNPAVYDMMVVDIVTRSNISVVYENLQKTFATNITEEQYIEAVKQQVSGVSGMTISFSDKLENVKLGKTEFKKCVCETEAYGVKMTQVYYLHKFDVYMASVIVTLPDGYSVADIEAMFR